MKFRSALLALLVLPVCGPALAAGGEAADAPTQASSQLSLALTLYAGVKSPGTDKESNWLPAPEGTFSLYIRAYWAEPAVIDATWQPPTIKTM